MDFLVIPDTYYENLRARLKDAPIKVEEDLDVVSWFTLVLWALCLYSGKKLKCFARFL